MRLLPLSRSRIAVAAAAALLCALAGAALYLRSVDAERERAGAAGRVVVEEEPLAPPNAVGVTLWLPDAAPVDVEPFGGLVYAATPAGLEAYDETGRLVRRYTTLDGLPENSITCLERFEGRLWAGTGASGLVAFDGSRFIRYRFVRPAAARVTALRAAAGELLVGTAEAGLLEYDGASFDRRRQKAAGDALRRVTAILEAGPRLYVGTYDAGLFEWREGATRNLGKAEGLASNRVIGLALRDGRLLVATDLGVSELDAEGRAAVVDATPAVTGLAVRDGRAWISSLTRGVAPLGDGRVAVRAVADGPGPSLVGEALAVEVEDDVLWAMTSEGLFASLPSSGTGRFEPFGDAGRRGAGLSAGHVSALALDARGRLWAGMFDGGVDVVDPETGERVDRVDDPALREVNALAAEPGSERVWVASSKGLALFEGGRRARFYGPEDGLVGENAAAVALGAGRDGAGLAVATNGGLSLLDGAVARSLTAFHGLPNNHAYAVAAANGRTYVGTLGGLAEVDGLRVSRVFTTATSRLPHNWVNALAALDGRLYVGTYGGGVAVLSPSGDLAPAEETAGLEINPGAMLAVDGRVYAGTLDAGLYALDAGSGRWTRVAAALGSLNVTALAADARYLYVGTENGITRIARSALA